MIKKKVRLKLVPLMIAILLVPILITVVFLNINLKEESIEPDYVTETIVEDILPVINQTKKIIRPYQDKTVRVLKNFYDYQSDEALQKTSIIVHENNYIQNSGVDYGKDTEFEVISILEGTVISVKEDDSLKGTIEIKHDNGFISVYQSLKDIKVKKDQVISQGQVLGTATTNELDKDLGNHLHFELLVSGQNVNPEIYLDKELS
ncbi:MAG: M23 family metallopeptidase [Bacilli bacterium]|nr:M23 family metallopeptidase [Bacilli bacterium]